MSVPDQEPGAGIVLHRENQLRNPSSNSNPVARMPSFPVVPAARTGRSSPIGYGKEHAKEVKRRDTQRRRPLFDMSGMSCKL
jgi:hypothetical protein